MLSITSKLASRLRSIHKMGKRKAVTEGVYQTETAKSEAVEAFQGPFPPWCVGSTFFPPQLVTSNPCPLSFNQVGKPECILSPGHAVEFKEDTIFETSRLKKSLRVSGAFIPTELLQDHLEADAGLEKAFFNQKKKLRGNRLDSVKCSDGNIILFFPCGKIGEKIGSSLCYPRVDGAWYPVRKSSTAADCGDLEKPHWSVSPSCSQSILQLSAVMVQPNVVDGREYVYVAARTYYQIHFCILIREVERIRFVSTYGATFRTHVCHVTWNPHLDREAAVLLGSGEVSLFDVPIWKSGHTTRTMAMKAKLTLENPGHSLRVKSRYGHSVLVPALDNFELRKEHDPPKDDLDAQKLLDEIWGRCEFGWHPQILLVSGLRKVVQMDYRRTSLSDSPVEGVGCANKKCSSDISIIMNLGATSTLPGFCYGGSKEEHIRAFARAECDGMCKFLVATEKHLMLFDTRRVGAPILQWEHGMTGEPPNLLIMLHSSTLQSCFDRGKLRNYQNGRAIVAVNYKSGDIRLFFYGSKEYRESSTREKYSALQNFEGYDWDDATFAWEMPIKIYPPKTVTRDWSNVVPLSHQEFRIYGHARAKPKGLDCISGIIILSHQMPECFGGIPQRAFTMLQLTGWGDILLQQYKASEQATIPPTLRLDSMNRGQVNADEEEAFDAEDVDFFIFGAFLKYMRSGCTLVCPFADVQSASGCAEGGASFDDVNHSNEDGMSRDSTEVMKLLCLKKEKSIIDSHFKSHLKTVLQHLSIPMNMFEVAHAVLGNWLPFARCPPSDFAYQCRLSPKFCTFAPLIYSGPGPPFESDQVILGKPGRAVPSPCLLEIQHWMKVEGGSSNKSDCNNGDSKLCRNVVAGAGEEVEQCDKASVANSEQSGPGKRIVPGQKLLREVYRHVSLRGSSLKELVEKQVPSVTSLGDPKDDWLKSELESQIFHHEISTDIFIKPESVDNLTFMDKLHNSHVAQSDVEFDFELGRSMNKEWLSKFIAGKPLTSGGNDKEKRFSNLDTELCPIKLSFTSRNKDESLEEHLEEQEWTALESLQAQFRDWQHSLEPYCKLYG